MTSLKLQTFLGMGQKAEGMGQQRASYGADRLPLSNVHTLKKLDGIFKDVFQLQNMVKSAL